PARINGGKRHLTIGIRHLEPAEKRLAGAVVPRLRILRVVPARVALPDFHGGVREWLTILIRVHDGQRQREREPWSAFGDVASENRLFFDHAKAVGIRPPRSARRGRKTGGRRPAGRRARTHR